MFQGDIGDGNASVVSLVPLHIPQSATVSVKNVAGATINYYTTGADAAAGGTIASGATTSFTTRPAWIAADPSTGGRSSIQLTGGTY